MSSFINNGEFNFNSNNELCIGDTPLNDFIDNYLIDPNEFSNNDYEIALENKNELVKNKTKLSTPIFIYSKPKLVSNFLNYKNSFKELITDQYGIQTSISFSLKANYNPHILKIFHENGSWCSLVNKNELNLALKVGYKGENLIFNGNGKTLSEIELAVKSNCYLNIDSLFNLLHTIKICKKLSERETSKSSLPSKIVIRINQSISAQVHQYLDTSVKSCKFGVAENEIEKLIEIIKQNEGIVKLVGFHTHLGSTIKTLDVYDKSVENIVSIVNMTKEKYKMEIDLINFGGGLGIDYEKYASRTRKQDPDSDSTKVKMPTPYDLALVVSKYVKDLKNVRIVVEPGRSLVGNTGILLTNLIGVKRNEYRNFLVVDASMCECIRPCLYSAYHHIDYVRPLELNKNKEYGFVDVVGPVCESGDFLGKIK